MNNQFRQITFSPYKEQVYEELKNAIMNNILKANTIINERDIAERLGVSRTPVRDALRLLEFEGWVKTVPWKGTYVTDLQFSDVKEVMQLRQGLETLGVDLIENVPEEKIVSLRNTLEKIYDHALRNEQREWMHYDKIFHLTLLELAGNSRLLQIVSNLSDHIVRIGIIATTLEGRIIQSASEHKAIFEALESRDLQLTKLKVHTHLENTKKAIFAVLDKKTDIENTEEGKGDEND